MWVLEIFEFSVDIISLSEQPELRFGNQLLSANKIDFPEITHSDAIKLLHTLTTRCYKTITLLPTTSSLK
jgi:hypothetical protein